MERRSLGIVAIMLIGLMALVATAGLDNLPPSDRKSVADAKQFLASDRSAFIRARTEIERSIGEELVLFQAKTPLWRARLDQDAAQLDKAATQLAEVQKLAAANRRVDAYYVERGLSAFDAARHDALNDESAIRAEAERRLTSKHALPSRLDAMRADYNALQTLDTGTITASAGKAMVDWPAKRDDLQKRLDGLQELKKQGSETWDASAKLRLAAEGNHLADSDLEDLLNQADRLDAVSKQAKESASAIGALAGQLYVGWDKVLLDLEHAGDSRERVRVVRTKYPDASLTHGETTSEELWEPAGRLADERHTGLVIGHKPAGKYDSEAEESVEPPAYSYIAPPGESNHYGSWSGGVWHWLPEYLLMSQLLHASRAPVSLPDYEAYQSARQRGQVFYGRNQFVPYASPGSRRGTVTDPASGGGGWWKERPRSVPAPPVESPNYAGSKYRSQGSYSGSRYQSRGSFGSGNYGNNRSSGTRSYSRSRGGRR